MKVSVSYVRIDIEFNVIYKNTGQYPIILDKNSGVISGYKLYQKSSGSILGLIEFVEDEFISLNESDKEGAHPSKPSCFVA